MGDVLGISRSGDEYDRRRCPCDPGGWGFEMATWTVTDAMTACRVSSCSCYENDDLLCP